MMGGCLSTLFVYLILRQFCEVYCILERKKTFRNEMDSTATPSTSEKRCEAPVYEEIHLSENVAYVLPQKI